MSSEFDSGSFSERPLNVLIYCRASSTELSADEQANAFDGEVSHLSSWVTHHFFRPINVHVVKANYDAKSRESALALMKELIQTGVSRTIVLRSLDRLGRGLDVFEFLEFANKSKARVYAVDDGVDTASEDWRVLAMFAALKREFSPDDDV